MKQNTPVSVPLAAATISEFWGAWAPCSSWSIQGFGWGRDKLRAASFDLGFHILMQTWSKWNEAACSKSWSIICVPHRQCISFTHILFSKNCCLVTTNFKFHIRVKYCINIIDNFFSKHNLNLSIFLILLNGSM